MNRPLKSFQWTENIWRSHMKRRALKVKILKIYCGQKSFIDIMWTEEPFEHFCEHLESFSIDKAFKAFLYLFNGQKTFFRSHINMGALKVKIFKINCCQKSFLMYFVDKS